MIDREGIEPVFTGIQRRPDAMHSDNLNQDSPFEVNHQKSPWTFIKCTKSKIETPVWCPCWLLKSSFLLSPFPLPHGLTYSPFRTYPTQLKQPDLRSYLLQNGLRPKHRGRPQSGWKPASIVDRLSSSGKHNLAPASSPTNGPRHSGLPETCQESTQL